MSSISPNTQVTPGNAHLQLLDGTSIDHSLGAHLSSQSNKGSFSYSVPLSLQSKLIAEKLYQDKLREHVQSLSTDSSTSNSSTPQVSFPRDPVAQYNFKLFQDIQAGNNLVFGISKGIASINTNQTCIDNSIKCIQNSATTNYNGLLNTVIQAVLDYAIEQINTLLPSQFRLSASITTNTDGTITINGMSLGPISYDMNKGTVSLGGSEFNVYAQQGLNQVNQILPSFLQMEVNVTGVTLGPTGVSMETLKNNPDVIYKLGNQATVSNRDGAIVVDVGAVSFVVGAVGQGTYLGAGLNKLNQLLPSGLAVTVGFTKGTLLPTIGMGPLVFNLAKGDFSYNSAIGDSLFNTGLDAIGVNSLPAPVGIIARAAWEALDLPGLLGLTEKKTLNPNYSLTGRSYCNGDTTSGVPTISFPASPNTVTKSS